MTSVETSPGFDLIQVRIENLSSKMDTLISIQEKVLSRLDSMSEELVGIERDMETLKVDKEEMPPANRMKGPARSIGGEMKEMYQEMNSIMTAVNKRSEQQTQKLEGVERLVMSIQQVVSFIGESVKTSKITEFMFKGPAARKNKAMVASVGKNQDSKNGTKKQASGEPVPGKVNTTSVRKQALLLEEVQKLNRENAERSTSSTGSEAEETHSQNLQEFILDQAKESVVKQEECLSAPDSQEGISSPEVKEEEEKVEQLTAEDVQDEAKEMVNKSEEEEVKESKSEEEEVKESKEDDHAMVDVMEVEDDVATQSCEPDDALIGEPNESAESLEPQTCEKDSLEENEQPTHVSEDLCGRRSRKIHLDFGKMKKMNEKQFNDDDECEQFFIDCTPPPPAPFGHRVVSAKPNQISNFYTINYQEIIGGGRFGQVHRCMENSSGLTLAAKIIKARSPKEKEVVKNEIQVMNHLDHANLIQLYAAYESRNDIILVLE
ncbi:Myosin light chain kinase family member 4 [Bagarius yarrelli]|uniref:Myosin light chain kinase family member 4 n=1 Tax=Bagarius yarrelli TaxID=175774 RepID=A0A556V140_BAGYA|nr:Myosin light chain kinase family member 4 [Bagarius yarrelli]